MVTLQDVTQFIASADNDQLDVMWSAAKARTKALKAEDRIAGLAKFKVGDTVELHGLSPKYLNGCIGEITAREGDRFWVALEENNFLNPRAWERFGKHVRVPANCLKALG